MKTVSKKLFSLLLVAIMLVSAIPFQAFADDDHVCSSETLTKHEAQSATESGHGNIEYYVCSCGKWYKNADATEYIATVEETFVHFYEEQNDGYAATCSQPGKTNSKKCKFCEATLPGDTISATGEHNLVEVEGSAKAATCKEDGKEADKACANDGCTYTVTGAAISKDTVAHTWVVKEAAKAATCKEEGKTAVLECSVCGATSGGESISKLTTHTYASNTATECSVCGAARPKVTITFEVTDPYTSDTKTYTTNKFLMDQTVTSAMLLDAVKDLNIPNAEQITWKLNGKDFVGQKITGPVTVTAQIATEKVNLHVWYKIGDTLRKYKDIELDKALYKDTAALNYLIKNVDDDFVADVVDGKLGYEWKNQKWYDYYHQDQSLTDQSHLLNSDRSVVAKLTAVSTYKITFEVGTPGDTKPTLTKSDAVKNMSGNVMTVTYNKSIGTLPKAKCEGYVFKGWYTELNGQGTKYEDNRTYTVAGDTILYAYWEKQVTVIVRTYVNSNVTTPVKLAMDGYSEGDPITYDAVKARVKQNYKGFTMDGLFDSNSWPQYKDSNYTKKGAEALTVSAGTDGTYSVYVRLRNASTSSSSTGDSTNYKTGDSAMIYTAAVVLVLAACGLGAAAYFTKKKKQG